MLNLVIKRRKYDAKKKKKNSREENTKYKNEYFGKFVIFHQHLQNIICHIFNLQMIRKSTFNKKIVDNKETNFSILIQLQMEEKLLSKLYKLIPFF